MKAMLLVLSTIFFFLSIKASFADCNNPIHGINLVPMPGALYKGVPDMKFPDESHIIYYKSIGFNAIRLPIEWEKLQQNLNEDLNARYLNKLIKFLDLAKSHHLKVVVDLHNYGRYKGVVVGSNGATSSAFYDVWRRLAIALHRHQAVLAYGLMNEPHDTNNSWHKVAQFGINGIRSVDKEKFIYVSGDSWSSAERWGKVNPLPFVFDSSNRIVYEAHVYFDDDSSGTYKHSSANVNIKKRVESRVSPFIGWLKQYNQQGVFGEFGVPMTDAGWLDALSQFLDMAAESCTDWFIWAGGPWRETYELSLEAIDSKDRPQISLIRQKLSK